MYEACSLRLSEINDFKSISIWRVSGFPFALLLQSKMINCALNVLNHFSFFHRVWFSYKQVVALCVAMGLWSFGRKIRQMAQLINKKQLS